MEAIAIVNPMAARGRVRRVWPRLEQFLHRAGHAIESWWTEGPGHAIELARQACRAQVTRVLAVGGDGTVHEVVNGIGAVGPEGPVLGIVALGRGNDYYRSLCMRRDPYAMATHAVNGKSRRVDLGELVVRDARARVTRRYFINVAGFGFDARVAQRANREPAPRFPNLVYIFSVLREIGRLENFDLAVRFDGDTVHDRVALFVLALGRYFGNGMQVAPQAQLDDGQFDCIWASRFSRGDILRCLVPLFRGTHLGRPRIHFRRAASLAVETAEPIPVEADGEFVGFTPLEARVLPRRIRVSVVAPGEVSGAFDT